jgi:hypothetical protein
MSIVFRKWNEIEKYIIDHTGCKPYSGAGINYRAAKKTTILRSVDNTYYYDDNLEDSNRVEYTLFGQEGDQDEDEKRFNEPLLNLDKTENIFLYRVRADSYVWYGKYKIVDKYEKLHIDKNYEERVVIILVLEKVGVP